MAVNIFLDLPGDLKMPILGLGTWQATEEELTPALDAALELGYRHFDTAFVYHNEVFIGKVLKKWFDSGKLTREDVFITTKLPLHGINPNRVEHFLKKSLKNLQLDYVDLYLAHFTVGFVPEDAELDVFNFKTNEDGEVVTEPTDHIAVWKKLEEQVDAGRTKTIGLSNYNISQIARILESARIKPANLQVELHLYLQQPKLVDFCHENGITVVGYSPLASPDYNKFAQSFGGEIRELPNILGDAVVAQIAQKHSKTPAQVALRFQIQRGVAPIPKSVSAKRLKENIDVFDFELDDADMEELAGLDIGEPARVCDFQVFKGVQNHPEFPFGKDE